MKKTKRVFSWFLTCVMLLGLLPAMSAPASAASGGFLDVWVGAGRIGNGGFEATDLFINFKGGTTPGFSVDNHATINGNEIVMDSPSNYANFTLTVADNPLLKYIANSSTAEYRVWAKLTGTEDKYHSWSVPAHDDNDRARLKVFEGNTKIAENQSEKDDDLEDTIRYVNTDWRSFSGVETLKFNVDNWHHCKTDDSGDVPGSAKVQIELYIRDNSGPVLSSYIGSYDTAKSKENLEDGKNELLIKLGTKNVDDDDPENRYYSVEEYDHDTYAMESREWVQLDFNFSKLVTAGSFANNSVSPITPITPAEYEAFSTHTLFTNTLGTGYVGQGLDRNLVLAQSIDNVSGFLNSLSYRYTATYGDYYGNNPISDGGGIERRNSYGDSLLEKINAAGFHDAAGNPVTGIDGSKGTNIFDKRDDGYDVIVDAVPPTYSRVGNGIAPDILTQLVLNENDTVDFIVSFSEATITNRDFTGGDANTYLMLDNGKKAKFKEKSDDGKQWIFTYKFEEGEAEEASLLKVIALGNDALDGSLYSGSTGKHSRSNDAGYTYDVDGRTITDYVGNIMSDRANEDSSTNSNQIESSIGWAGLTIDNKAPKISFTYSVYGTGELQKGTDKEWGQAAKIQASAEDPLVPVAKYDPDYSDSNTERPSKGIYRPDNTTGGEASAVGLIFYVWTRSVTPPSTGENFEAIKRFSLTGVQPKEVTGRPYASAWSAYKLMMANNFSDINPPDSAMTSEGDGAWYLHVWTADMTWDSARQLMQYQKAQTLQYNVINDNDVYDYPKFLAEKEKQIEAYRKGDLKSYSELWDSIKADFYDEVYSEQFNGWLERKEDKYSDEAMDYADREALSQAESSVLGSFDGVYKGSYTDSSADSYKSTTINTYKNDITPNESTAWEKVRDEVFNKAFSAGFVSWLKENDGVNDTEGLTDIENFVEGKISTLAVKYGEERAPYKKYTQDSVKYYYTAATAATAKTDMINQYIEEHPTTPNSESEGEHNTTDEEAWAAVKEQYYAQVYSAQFTTWLEDNYEDYETDDIMAAAIAEYKEIAAYRTGYNAAAAAALPLGEKGAIQTYIKNNTPDEAAAWDKVKKDVYEELYTEAFLALLKESGSDIYSDDAMTYAKQQKIKYKGNYTLQSSFAKKKEMIAEANGSSAPGASTETPSFEDAWEAVKESVYNTVFTSEFIGWLNERSDPYSDAAMVYARAQALLTLTQYDDTSVWPLEDYAYDDSNWAVKTTRLLLDNTPPADAVYLKDNMIGDGTAAVELPFTVSDALSGIKADSVLYQWVEKKDGKEPEYDEVQWVQAVEDSKETITNPLTDALESPVYGVKSLTCTAKTLGNVTADGDYILFIKYSDVAGNTTITNSGDFTVNVNSANAISCTFGPEEALAGYRNEIVPTALVKGVTVSKFEYAVTDSLKAPAEASYTELAAESADAAGKAYSFKLPALKDEKTPRADGTWYVHVKVYQYEGDPKPSYFRQAYRLDTKAPTVTISPDGFGAEQDSLEVMVGLSDELAGLAEGTKYNIVPTNEALGPEALGWLELPENGMVEIRAKEKGEYYLHILAADTAGNGIEKVSGMFKLRGTSAPTSLPGYSCQLLAVYEKEEGELYGVANLNLIKDDKTGFRYSVSTNGGDTWCNWLPYMSMIKMKLPEDYAAGGRLKVKFRAPDGTTGEEREISIRTVENAIWATAEFDSTFKRQTGNTLTFLMDLPEDVTATPFAAEEGAPVATPLGANFTVSANGVYEFELARGEQTADSHFVVVVDIFDDEAPAGYISYSEVAPTNGTVVVTVKASEPVYVKKLTVTYADEGTPIVVEPKFQFSFVKNGSAEFVIADEAQNVATLTAEVVNIDKDAPGVTVGKNYDLYKTVGDIASGVTLEAKKPNPSGEDFSVVNNDRKTTMEVGENGEYTFIVRDKVGNVAQASEEVRNIVKTMPGYTVEYNYVAYDGAGAEIKGEPVAEGQWRQGKVMATVTFDALKDGRKLYLGPVMINETRKGIDTDGKPITQNVSNELGKSGGKYVYTRTYMANGEAAVVVCDDLGNTARIPIVITGLDNAPPKLTLEKPTAVISNEQTKRLSQLSEAEVKELFGGFIITDNVYTEPSDFTVTVARSDDKSKTNDEDKGKLDEVGKFTLVYTVKDPAGNVSYAEQTLIIIPADGLLIEAGDGRDFTLLSSLSTNSSILPDNHIEFRIDQTRMQYMFYGTDKKKVQNTDMRYDILYVRGLYREGQLKTIASKLTSEELISKSFKVTFEKAGWYTIIIRNQERTREYTTFFIAATSDN